MNITIERWARAARTGALARRIRVTGQAGPVRARLYKWLEPELFQPFMFGVLLSITLSEFVRGALVFSVLPNYGRTVLGFAVEWTSLALSIHYLVDNGLRSPVGWFVDKVGQRPALLIGFAISAASVFGMMHVHTLRGLLLCMALYGIGVTPMWPCAVSAIGLATPPDKRAAFMGYMYIFWLIGAGLGPVLINLVAGGTYRLAFWIMTAVDALGVVAAWFLVHRPERLYAPAGHAMSAAEAVRNRLRGAIGREYWKSLWQNIKKVAFLFPGMFVQTFAVASLVPILSLYANVVLHLSPAAYSALLVCGGLLVVLFLLPAGRLVDRFGPRRFLVPAFLIAGTGLGLYTLHHTLWTTYVMVGIVGLCYAFILPAWNSVLDHAIDPDKKGALWGVFMTVEGLGSTVGPYLGGLMWDAVSPEAPFFLSAAVIILMGLLYIVLPIETRRQRLAAERKPVPDN
jgi:DHA1 family multidrug resistance protein-like MFS transporter